MPSRIACLIIPSFSLAAALRARPELRYEAVALVDGAGSAAPVLASTHSALTPALSRGLSCAQARALFPHLVFQKRDRDAEKAASQALIEVAEAFSPRVEVEEPADDDGPADRAYLDLFNEANESAFGERLIARAKSVGLGVKVGIADSKLGARVAAEAAADDLWIVAPGGEKEFFAPLSAVYLHPDVETAARLDRWGLRTIGRIAALSANDLLRRLGTEGLRLHQQANAEGGRALIPRVPETRFFEGVELEWPVCELGPFLFVATKLLRRLVERLDAQGVACRRLSCVMKLDPAGTDARALTLPAPAREVESFLRLLQEELERKPPEAPIAGLSFSVEVERPRRAQLSLFGPPALSPDGLNQTLARLSVLLGKNRVGRPVPVNRHRPDGFALAEFNPPPADLRPELDFQTPACPHRRLLRNGMEAGRPAWPERRLLRNGMEAGRPPARRVSVRILRPRVKVRVFWHDEERNAFAASRGPAAAAPAESVPSRIDSSVVSPHALRIAGQVRVASGPWRLEEGWWTPEAVARDYWDVELSDGAVYRVYHDRKEGEWWVDGVYD